MLIDAIQGSGFGKAWVFMYLFDQSCSFDILLFLRTVSITHACIAVFGQHLLLRKHRTSKCNNICVCVTLNLAVEAMVLCWLLCAEF